MNYMENLLIYVRNLSPFYIVSMAISIIVVMLTAYLGLTGCVATADDSTQSEHVPQKKMTPKSKPPADDTDDSNTSDDSEDDPSHASDEDNAEVERRRQLHIESLGQLKSAKLKSIENTLTEEQRQAEKEIERAQLAAIFELLKKQTDSSNLNEDDLKEQLSLYR